MNKNDSVILKILAELDLRKTSELTPEQEYQLKIALDPEEQFFNDLKKIFNKTQ